MMFSSKCVPCASCTAPRYRAGPSLSRLSSLTFAASAFGVLTCLLQARPLGLGLLPRFGLEPFFRLLVDDHPPPLVGLLLAAPGFRVPFSSSSFCFLARKRARSAKTGSCNMRST